MMSKGITVLFNKAIKLSNKLSSNQAQDIERLTSDIFADQLSEYIRELLYSDKSLMLSVFDKKELEHIVESHFNHTTNNLQIIGFMITLEHYKKMMENVFRKSQRNGY